MKRWLTAAAALALAASLVYGLAQLFALRFEHGDIYPPYSTLRADPLGTKGLYDALADLPHLETRRNFRPIVKLRTSGPATLIYAGTPHRAFWTQDELRHLEQMVANGLRVVITFLPFESGRTVAEEEREARSEKQLKEKREKEAGDKQGDKSSKKDDPANADPEAEDEKPLLPFKDVAERWGFRFRVSNAPDDKSKPVRGAQLAGGADAQHLEPELSWHTALYFAELKPEWRTVYTSETQPVVMERRYGDGSIVLAADSFFLSNEALRTERHPQLLAWLCGGAALLVFDEESHGVREAPGLAALVRKYGLQGALVSLLLLAALFIWKSMIPFVPPHPESSAARNVIAGRQTEEGFVSLLRRCIPPRDLLGICAEEWKKAFDHDGRNAKAAHVERVVNSEQARPPRERHLVAAYQTIVNGLRRK